MSLRSREQETICALATPTGVGGIAVIRVSGTDAAPIVRRCFSNLPAAPQSHRVYYGFFCYLESPGERIDEVLVTFFEDGRSFTGEATVEISCHGSPRLAKEILHQLLLAGAKAANPGEFTYRAFMNGRLDLVQAESVLDLIHSNSKRSAQVALRQLEGKTSVELSEIEDGIIWSLAHIEASIDFSTEGIDVVETEELIPKLEALVFSLEKLLHSYRSGRIIKDGLRVALVGAPNVGKSSLLNLVLGQERAIVTEIAGTTRDLVDGQVLLGGYQVLLIDTAGVREAHDIVEKLGIQRSIEAAKEADLVLFVFDSSRELSTAEIDLLSGIELTRVLLIGNMADRARDPVDQLKQLWISRFLDLKIIQGHGLNVKDSLFIMSALDQKDGDALRLALEKVASSDESHKDVVLTNARHFEGLTGAFGNIKEALVMIRGQASPELVSIELKEALLRVQETIGKRFDDQILDRVFKEFCLGK